MANLLKKTLSAFQFWFFYQKSIIEREIETFVYDFSGIVASVGGSLGLFLGFSCLQESFELLVRLGSSYFRAEQSSIVKVF